MYVPMVLKRPIRPSAVAPTPGATPQSSRYFGRCVVMKTSWKPQAKNASVMKMIAAVRHASRSASPSFRLLRRALPDGRRLP